MREFTTRRGIRQNEQNNTGKNVCLLSRLINSRYCQAAVVQKAQLDGGMMEEVDFSL